MSYELRGAYCNNCGRLLALASRSIRGVFYCLNGGWCESNPMPWNVRYVEFQHADFLIRNGVPLKKIAEVFGVLPNNLARDLKLFLRK